MHTLILISGPLAFSTWSETVKFVGFLAQTSSAQSTVLDGLQVRTLGWPFQKLNASLIYPFLSNFRCVMVSWLEHPTASKTLSSADDFRFSWTIWRLSSFFIIYGIVENEDEILPNPTFFGVSDQLAAKQPHIIILPAPCVTQVTGSSSFFLSVSLKLLRVRPVLTWSIWANHGDAV